ncbi:hypothetical protein VTP01DRAFT_5657 [Rhizomucor pusillus]|uniref:uncharacterized protein n=1 Tax=Rhizomucor pusillus TaxID=4840 RepID=UPI0037424582
MLPMYRQATSKLLVARAAMRPFSVASIAQSRWSDLVKQTKESLQIKEVSPSELKTELAGAQHQPIIIDVREGPEWQKTGKIPNAVCLSRGVLELTVEDVVPPESDKPIVLYCAGGLRSIMAAESLIRMGYNKDNIKSLKGGFVAWKKEGFDVQKD